MKKLLYLILLFTVFFTTCDLVTPAKLEEIVRDNEFDPESEEFAGMVTEDSDGDGIADIDDVDEIVLVYPENNSTIGDATPSLSMSPKSEGIIQSYCFQVSENSDFSSNLVDLSDSDAPVLNIGLGILENESSYYWRGGVKDLIGNIYWGTPRRFTLDISISSISDVTPEDNSIINDTTPELSWEDIEGVDKYWVQLSASSSFSSVIEEDNNISTLSYQIDTVLNNNSTYYWRVRPYASEVWGSWSSGYTFTVDLSAVLLLEPSNGGSLSDTAPTLSWQLNSEAIKYHLVLDNDSDFSSPIIDDSSLTGTSYTLSGVAPELLSNGSTYYWKVAGIDENDVESAFSSIWNYSIDSIKPSIPVIVGEEITNNNQPLWSWSYYEDVSIFRYKIGDATEWILTGLTSIIPSTPLSDNTISFYLQAADEAGNWSDSAMFNTVVDTQAPSIPVLNNDFIVTNNNLPSWSWDNDIDSILYRYKIDENSWVEISDYMVTLSSELSDGEHTFYLQGCDSANNWSDSAIAYFIVDTVHPTVLQFDINNPEYASLTFPFSILFSEEMNSETVESSFSITPAIEGVITWNLTNTEMTFTPDTSFDDGEEYNVTINSTCVDLAGNSINSDYSDFFTTAVLLSNIEFADSNLRDSVMSLSKFYAHQVTELYASNMEIASLSGIEALFNLQNLSVVSNNISDITPISNLVEITYLNISNNNINDFSAIASLVDLESLALNSNPCNNLNGISSLSKLRNLDATNLNISDITPIQTLYSLEQLTLTYNNISNLDALENLTSLQSINLASNSFSDISSLSNLTNLENIILAHNTISDLSPIADLENLILINLQGVSFSDLSFLSNLNYLTSIDFGGNNDISDLTPIQNLTQLTRLEIYGNSISDLSPISNMINLEELFLGNNLIDDISDISTLVNLDTLHIEYNNISDISALTSLNNLRRLNLSYNDIDDISALAAKVSIEDLVIVNANIQDVSILSGLTNIRLLNIQNCNIVYGIRTLENLTNAQYIYLTDNPSIPYSDIEYLELQLPDCNINY